MISISQFRIIALTPAGIPRPEIAIAAARAGEIGVVDLEYTTDLGSAKASFQTVSRYTNGDFGIKLGESNTEWLNEFLSESPEHFRLMLLSATQVLELKSAVQSIQSHGLRVFIECHTLEQANHAEQMGVDAVIAKGNESGGRVGPETTYILLQKFIGNLSIPVYAQGGIGLHTAAACYAGGAHGVVLDNQMLLTRESPLSQRLKNRLITFDGSETVCIGEELGQTYRVCTRLGLPVVKELQSLERNLSKRAHHRSQVADDWHQAIARRIGWDSAEKNLLLMGQDIAFAASLGKRFVTVSGILQAVRKTVESHIKQACRHQPFSEGSPLAQSHRTRYPIVQGPMARISDNPAFALQVAEKGALPFLAVSWMHGNELDTLLQKTRSLLKDYSWGVGLLGFLPAKLYQEQIKVVQTHHPSFALLGGGRPDQVKRLEQEGIATYAHVPSPALLKMFMENGVCRFVFEGLESGGHIGPRCSFVLWDQLIDILLEETLSEKTLKNLHILFAGGIHDSVSSAMVSAAAAPLVERGIRVGVQLGSAYLLTHEAVETAALVKDFQQAVLKCNRTVVLESGGGHANRSAETPFAKTFRATRQRLLAEGQPSGKIRQTLDRMTIGKLRIAAKGFDRNPVHANDPSKPNLVSLSRKDRWQQGLYLVGQLAALHQETFTISELHRQIADGSCEKLDKIAVQAVETSKIQPSAAPCDIAIIGMACLLPKAPDLQRYWENILNKKCAIKEVPFDRWDWKLYYSEDRTDPDMVYSKWGAFLEDIAFDPIQYGMPPKSLTSIEPLQLLTLEVASRAIEDAGYRQRSFPKERTAVILGMSGVADLAHSYCFRSALPMFIDESAGNIYSRFGTTLPQWTEDTFPGILPNVAAGRIANRLDLGGTNFVVDGACASSLAAVYTAVRELETYAADIALVGGADTMQNPFTYLCFSKTQALSPRGQCCPLDESADGIVIGEGIAMVVLKRLAEAERDGDKIYAVIKGVGAASDGKDKSLTAPSPQGQLLALERAYLKSNVSPATVGLIEAHATGTAVGDKAEIEALSELLKKNGAGRDICAIGSVKSMIGHTKSTAGIAGLIKAALSLYHKVLPPTLGVEKPNRALGSSESPLYANTESRPWILRHTDQPRRAGVSAFGFGGTNFHVVLEEYKDDYLDHMKMPSLQEWPSELLTLRAHSRSELLEDIKILEKALGSGVKPSLAELAFAYARTSDKKNSENDMPQVALSIVTVSLSDLAQKLSHIRELLNSPDAIISDPRGIYFSEKQPTDKGKIAFLFPGQGSQYPNMVAELACIFPEIRNCFERSNQILQDKLPQPLSAWIFPKPVFSDAEKFSQENDLAQTQIAQPAMGTADLAIYKLLKSFGLEPDMVAGHSYGEYVALCAAGVIQETDLILLSEARARFMAEAAQKDPGAMAAVNAGADTVEKIIGKLEGIWIANINAPKQTVVSGTHSAIETVIQKFGDQGIRSRKIPVSCAFHSPLISPARERLKKFLASIKLSRPQIKVFSNSTASAYQTNPRLIYDQLVHHLISRVEFVREIEAMYHDGARIFVEVGPGGVLKNLVDQILGDRAHLAVISNQSGRRGMIQFQHLLGQLAVHGVSVKLQKLFKDRSIHDVDLNDLLAVAPVNKLSATTWFVNGARAIPISDVGESQPKKKIELKKLGVAKEMNPKTSPTESNMQDPELKAQGQQFSNFSSVSTRPDNRENEMSSPSHLSGDGISQAMAQYQRLMQRFLEVQKNVMHSYFRQTTGHAGDGGVEAGEAPRKLTGQHQSSLKDLQVPSSAEKAKIRSHSSLPEKLPIESSTDSEALVAVADSASSAKMPPDRKTLTLKLLEIVSERTGYPQEMLELDLDLEADLGIDSIKRVEILGQFLQFVFGSDQEWLSEEMEDLNRIKTLRKIIDCVEVHKESPGKNRPADLPFTASAKTSEHSTGIKETSSLPRFTLTAMDVPPPSRSLEFVPNRVILVTDDGRGIASALTEKLKNEGHEVAIIRFGKPIKGMQPNCYVLKDESAEAIFDVVETIRKRQGAVGGLIHLLPLRKWASYEKMDILEWRKRLQPDVKTLFHLLKLLEHDLTQTADEGAAFVASATAMGGCFASDPILDQHDFFPGHGAIPGLLKTVAIEWPEVRVKVVDLCLNESASDLANHLMTEIQADDSLIEVGYRNSRRLTLGLVETPLGDRTENTMEIDSSWIILVTGGARGITAEVAQELARQYRPTLILAGRSPLPPDKESDATARLVQPKEIKNALISGMKSSGEPVNLAKVEAAYKKIHKEREIRTNLAQMQKAGAKVEYMQVDVRDEKSFGQLIEKLYQQYGHIDGVIHGAGIIEDKLFTEKTWKSFDRVFGTKTESAFILSRKLKPETLKFFVIFSSVAGRFGNRGQCDYTAANEVVNKIAEYLNRNWPGRIISPNWGPWQGPGMVSPEVQRQFAERGVSLITPSAGSQFLDLEIQKGRKSEVEVLIGDGPWANRKGVI